MNQQLPILYSFRRCPYAMRARLAIFASQQAVMLREVVLRDKPQEMLDISPKATVPVLQLSSGQVIDESLDIMKWALGVHDPYGWLGDEVTLAAMFELIGQVDGSFKKNLDRYKYGNRYPDENTSDQRDQGVVFLSRLNEQLEPYGQLFGAKPMLADYAIFPFVRQFANVDRTWFDRLDLPFLHQWLEGHLQSDLFRHILQKYRQWKTGDEAVLFGQVANATVL